MGGVWKHQIRPSKSILERLLKTHRNFLNDESLLTLMTEVDSIINSRIPIVKAISDTKSDMPLSLTDLFYDENKYYHSSTW